MDFAGLYLKGQGGALAPLGKLWLPLNFKYIYVILNIKVPDILTTTVILNEMHVCMWITVSLCATCIADTCVHTGCIIYIYIIHVHVCVLLKALPQVCMKYTARDVILTHLLINEQFPLIKCGNDQRSILPYTQFIWR